MQATVPEEKLGLILKLSFYIFVAVIGLPVFGFLLSATGYLIAAAGSVFATAFTANSLALRVFERMPITAAGLGWRGGSGRNLAIGIVTGIVAATLVTLLPLALGMAEMKPDADLPASASGALFVTVLLLFGAIGEELLFRGYAFQILARGIGPVPTLIFSAALFGAVHMANLNANCARDREYRRVWSRAGLCLSAHRRVVASHRYSLRLELDAAGRRRECQRI